MQIELKHYLAVRADDGSGDIERRLACRAVVAEIEVCDDASSPMAISFRPQFTKSPSLFRYDVAKDRLLLKSGSVRLLASRALDEDKLWLSKGYPTSSINRRLKSGLKLKNGEEVRNPPVHSFSYLKQCNGADIRAADQELEECLSGWGVSGGALWKQVPEPLFHVYHTSDGWKAELDFAPSGRLGFDRRHFYFGLGQYQEMVKWKAHLAETTGRPATDDEFEMMGVYETKLDGYALDIRFGLEDIVYRFGKADDMDIVTLPLPLLDVFVRARSLVEIYKGEYSEATTEAMVALLEEVADIAGEYPEHKHLFAKPKETSFQLEKWYSRPISLSPGLDLPFQP